MKLPKLSPSMAVGLLAGVLYGVSWQIFFRVIPLSLVDVAQGLIAIMSLGFVFVLPVVIGFLTVYYATPEQQNSWYFRILNPLACAVTSLVISILVGWEGAICVAMYGVVFLPLSSVAGVLTGILMTARANRKLHSSVVAVILALPIMVNAAQIPFAVPVEVQSIQTQIEISATPSQVWQQIIRVPKITEPLDGFFYKMGFPKPLEATLSHEGVGGIRIATFERGLAFVETIDSWEHEKKISFSIASHPESIPTTTLDEHVVVGGEYFDVLRGTYEIEQLDEQTTLLKLSSRVRVSTRFNFYATLWARALMSDIQATILKVIRSRAEKAATQGETSKFTS